MPATEDGPSEQETPGQGGPGEEQEQEQEQVAQEQDTAAQDGPGEHETPGQDGSSGQLVHTQESGGAVRTVPPQDTLRVQQPFTGWQGGRAHKTVKRGEEDALQLSVNNDRPQCIRNKLNKF